MPTAFDPTCVRSLERSLYFYSVIKVRTREQQLCPLFEQFSRGDERIRTADPLRAKQVLSQLSYIPGARGYVHIATQHRRVSLRMRTLSASRGRSFRHLVRPEE